MSLRSGSEGNDDAVGNRTGLAPQVAGYQRLVVWQKAMDLVEVVYQLSHFWPREEKYGLTSQIRRAAVFTPSNLVEGHGKSGRREFAHHVSVVFGSLCEVETQLLIAQRLGYCPLPDAEPVMAEIASVRRHARSLLASLRSSLPERDNP